VELGELRHGLEGELVHPHQNGVCGRPGVRVQPALPTVLANVIGAPKAEHLEVMVARDGVLLLRVRYLGIETGQEVLAVDGQAEVARQEPNRPLEGQ
jgi:hypothetical protein